MEEDGSNVSIALGEIYWSLVYNIPVFILRSFGEGGEDELGVYFLDI